MDRDAVVARVLDAAQLQHLGAGGRHLEHLLEGDDRQLAGVGDDPRVGAEDAGDVGVDLADLGARAPRRARPRSCRSRRGRAWSRPWSRSRRPGSRRRARCCPRSSASLDPVGADVDDPRLRVGGVGDDPGLRAGQRDRLVAHVPDRHRAERAGDPLAGREQHVHLARRRAVGDLAAPCATSSSVVLPRAESTATTFVAGARARRRSARAARLRSSGPATEVPPNFITTMSL